MPYSVWLESENWDECDEINDNTDVVVTYSNGERWIATFITYSNLRTLVDRKRESGENLSGLYFWVDSMILVDNISRNSIEKIIKELHISLDFYSVFKRIEE